MNAIQYLRITKKLNNVCFCFSDQVWDVVCLLYFFFQLFWHEVRFPQQEILLYLNSRLELYCSALAAPLFCGIGNGVRIVYIFFCHWLRGGKLCWLREPGNTKKGDCEPGNCLVDLLLILHKYARFNGPEDGGDEAVSCRVSCWQSAARWITLQNIYMYIYEWL